MSCGILNFKKKHILLIGGGKYALQKAYEFVEDEAIVTCIAKTFIPEFEDIDVKKVSKEYERSDLGNCFMVYAATQHKQLNHQIVLDANAKNLISASFHRDEDALYEAMKFEKYDELTIALSTSGKFPAFSKTVFDDIRNVYEERYNEKLQYLGVIRDYILENGIEKKYLLEDLLESSIEELKFYCESIQHNKACVLVFHGVKKIEMYTEILKFIKKLNVKEQGIYFAYLDEEALKEYNYFVELNRIISLDKMMKTLDLLNIKQVNYQPMLFEKGMYYEQMQSILEGHTINPLLFDKQLLEAVLLNYVPHAQNLLVLPDLKERHLLELIDSLKMNNLTVMNLNDELPSLDKSQPLHVTGLFMLIGDDITRKVFGKNGVYVRLIETDYDAEMNKCILIQNENFIQIVKTRIK